DFFPTEALVAQVNQLALLLAEPLPRLLEQLLARNHAARGWVPARQGQFFHAAHGAAGGAAPAGLPPPFFCLLVLGRCLQHVCWDLWLFLVIFGCGGGDREESQHRTRARRPVQNPA